MRKSLFAVLFLVFCPLVTAQQSLNNDAVIKMVKAGLSDDVIVSTVNSSPGTYDTSADALIGLKAAGVDDKIVGAMIARASGIAPAPAVLAPSGNGLPAGIDEVGVYFKDKSGAWQSLMPEIVNFKQGGAMKKFMTQGIVKGDVNGHINGKHGKTAITFPAIFAIYVPEGTAITEYQLLRLRQSGDAREFRAVTGGVIHESGGSTRDVVEFQPQKLAPRVYQITMEAALGKGEYGFLPPGNFSAKNMGSTGKIYAVTVPE
ncbi:MAG TPA: hypothetical protein VGR47_05165 [Terracidiphilus sp.]|nr:hypothetical protein [Terracidiphilus sp.]